MSVLGRSLGVERGGAAWVQLTVSVFLVDRCCDKWTAISGFSKLTSQGVVSVPQWQGAAFIPSQ